MSYRLSAIAAIIALICMGCCCPCGVPMGALQSAQQAAEKAEYKNDLKQLGLMYHNYHDANGRGPAGWDELIESQQGDFDGVTLLYELQGRGLVVEWGRTMAEITGGLANTALAYEPSVDFEGGPVLMFDGSVIEMSSGELASAKFQGPPAEMDGGEFGGDADAAPESEADSDLPF